jgi:histidinol-phosphate/aromatic aminotransferase/cobyric acid decarboxylase-like protein
MSKSFGLAGVRIGWALTPNKAVMQNLMAIKAHSSICCSATDEALALIALENSEQIWDKNAVWSHTPRIHDKLPPSNRQKPTWRWGLVKVPLITCSRELKFP